ncbi:response regulator transcription factor [Maridesulfovibrio sp.]|uniref:response regulator transcription factor n=1 Tax=Maridesulfovibrio sp. TaxID=2795000 RepID=UPI002A18C258|nr:response regulator transcription factor [Maridesulfovibrio sp.]
MEKDRRFIVVDDHQLVRSSLKAIIEKVDGWTVIAEAENASSAIKLCHEVTPDVMLVDIYLPEPDGLKVIECVKGLNPDIRVMAVTALVDDENVLAALKAGADGYLDKSETQDNIAKAILRVTEGDPYFSPNVLRIMKEGFLKGRPNESGDHFAELTKREKELVGCILEGIVKEKELAAHLFIEIKTVQKHKTNIYRKLGISSLHELLQIGEEATF